jgi:uncharacterized protein
VSARFQRARVRVIESSGQDVVIAVRVIPRAGRSGVAGTRAGALLVRLNAPPVEGAANEELIQVIADLLAVQKRAVTIVSGERSRTKRVRVAGVRADYVASRLPH